MQRRNRGGSNIATIIGVIALLISFLSFYLSWRADKRQSKSEEREERAAALQVKPLVQTKPARFVFYKESNFGATFLEVANPSGYDAYEVTFDLKYNGIDWISEWLKANNQPPRALPKLEAGGALVVSFQGALPYPMDEICKKRKEFDVFVRTKWRNEKKRTFEVLGQYELICTTVGENQSVTFLLKKQTSGE